MSSLPEGELAVSDSQRGMTQDKVKLVCQCATPLKTGIFLREKLSSLLEGEWAVAEPQSGITQRMRRMTTRQTKKIKKESMNILLDAT